MSEKKVDNNVSRIYNSDSFYFFLVAVLGALLILIGMLCAMFQLPQRFVDINIQKNLELSPDSPIVDEWKNPSIPIYMRFYIFNVTNAPQIIKGGKPMVKECGPYTYRMYTRKFNVTYYSNDTVSFYNNLTLVFQPNMSVGTESDVIFHLNVPLASLERMMSQMSPWLIAMGFMKQILSSSGENYLFENHTAKEILFGYEHNIFVVIGRLMSMIGQDFDPVFGFFHKFNNSHDGCFLVDSGRKNYDNIHKIDRWNGQKYLSYWSTEYANMINGTDGSFFGPHVERTDKLYLYFPQMCRSIELEYEEDSVVKGIESLRFRFAKNLFANTKEEPNNAGFCYPPGRCYESGILNAESCSDGAPAFISLPHFFGAAETYRTAISGLAPTKEKHDSVFQVEPTTGSVLYGSRKLQINTLLQPSEEFDELKNVREVIFPIMWMSGGAEISDKIAADLRSVLILVKFMDIVGYLIISLGCSILLLAITCYLRMAMPENFFPWRYSKKSKTVGTGKDSEQISHEQTEFREIQ